MSAPLYALNGRYADLLERAEAGEDVNAALAAIDEAIQQKAVNVCFLLANLEAEEATASAEAKRLAGRAKVAANHAERLREYLKTHMGAARIKSVRSPQFVITLSDGQPKVVITDASKVPPELMRQPKVPEPEPDKVAILAAFKRDGVIPPGCDIVETSKLSVR
jgi:hypothetical protein